MAAGAASLVVLLLCCWRGAELQPINMTFSSTTDMRQPPRTKGPEDVPGVFDEMLVQEMLNPNKSVMGEAQRTAATMSTKPLKEQGVSLEENYQMGGNADSIHELLDNPRFSVGSEDKILNNEPSMEESYASPDRFREVQAAPGAEDSVSKHSEAKKDSKNDQYKLSVLDKILQNIGKSSGNSLQ
ncbi:sperm acrosome-associated protein 7 [Talpa occidentalis]|uniref:sperm acrosome-associated protein 7 n=1 Tax=Talpa occidentalis TaxID=50954 RepID=UPI00188F7606|nr:sperm acrosome-associated protein 7 [Talpa occidentalis]